MQYIIIPLFIKCQMVGMVPVVRTLTISVEVLATFLPKSESMIANG